MGSSWKSVSGGSFIQTITPDTSSYYGTFRSGTFTQDDSGGAGTGSQAGEIDITAFSPTQSVANVWAKTIGPTITAASGKTITTAYCASDALTCVATGNIPTAVTRRVYGPAVTGSGTKTKGIGLFASSGSGFANNYAVYTEGSIFFCGAGNASTAPSESGLAGTWFGWNVSAGNGESVFGNYRQGGGGGFSWKIYGFDGSLATSPMYLTSTGILTLSQSSSRIGIGTSSPACALHAVTSGTGITSFVDYPPQAFIEGTNLALSTQTGNLIVGTNTAQAVDIGGSIVFGGKYSDAGGFACYAGIKAGKTNSTSGDYGGYLSLCSRTTGQNITEAMRILGNQNVAIGGTTGSEKLTVWGNTLVTGSILSSGSTSGIGYATGSGGTVTQATSKSTSVTLNKVSGQITMNNASLASGVSVVFIVNNSTVSSGDVILATSQGGLSTDYRVTPISVSSGAFKISVTNLGTTQSEAVVINFVVLKAVSS